MRDSWFWTVKQKEGSLNNFGYFLYIPANIYLFPGNFGGEAISTFSLLSEHHTVSDVWEWFKFKLNPVRWGAAALSPAAGLPVEANDLFH